jgi:hypothetical protein
MTREQWLRLLPGDIIEVASGIERKILSVTHYKAKNTRKIRTLITLKKLVRRGWTPGPTTTYGFHDDRGRWKLKRS